MKRLFFIIMVAFPLVSCGGGNNAKNNNTTKAEKPQEKQLNISILLDLSDRINPNINPDAKKNDIENIKTITEFFTANMRHLNAYNAKGKIRLFLAPPPSNSDINSIVSKLNIDCSTMDNKGRKEIYDNLTELYAQNLEGIYNETISTSAWIGSDIWRFFKNDVKDYCVGNNPNYRNVLIILTDGYIYHANSKDREQNRYAYLLENNIKKYRTTNYDELINNDNFGLIAKRNDLNDLEVLVLEVKAENPTNKIDEDILPFVLKKWFNEMNISRYEVYRSDLPANTKTRIENFLNQK